MPGTLAISPQQMKCEHPSHNSLRVSHLFPHPTPFEWARVAVIYVHWNYYLSENATFLTLFFYPFKFLKQSRVNAELDCFFRTGSRQPVRPYTRQLSSWFSVGLRERGRTGHMII